MIHKVKSLYDQGHGLSKRAIEKKLGILNTISKYINMNEQEIQLSMAEDKDKQKQLPNLSTGTATNIPYRCNISVVISILAKMMENCLSMLRAELVLLHGL